MTILLLSFTFAFLLYLWLDTNVFVEYYNTFFRDNGFRIDIVEKYNKYNEAGFVENLLPYLRKQSPDSKIKKFIFKLITCKVCLSTWCGILSLPFVGVWLFAVSFLTLFFYNILRVADTK